MVGFALGVEVGDLEPALESRHAVVGERDPLAAIFER